MSPVFSHIVVTTNHFPLSTQFYDEVLATLGIQSMYRYPHAVGYGVSIPHFWVITPRNGRKTYVGNGTRIAFIAPNRAAVNLFYRVALTAGAVSSSEPHLHTRYMRHYYVAGVRDIDGHRIECACWRTETTSPSPENQSLA